jgi:hypothetical protein
MSARGGGGGGGVVFEAFRLHVVFSIVSNQGGNKRHRHLDEHDAGGSDILGRTCSAWRCGLIRSHPGQPRLDKPSDSQRESLVRYFAMRVVRRRRGRKAHSCLALVREHDAVDR